MECFIILMDYSNNTVFRLDDLHVSEEARSDTLPPVGEAIKDEFRRFFATIFEIMADEKRRASDLILEAWQILDLQNRVTTIIDRTPVDEGREAFISQIKLMIIQTLTNAATREHRIAGEMIFLLNREQLKPVQAVDN